MRGFLFVFLFCVFVFQLRADNADTLPKGIWRVHLVSAFSYATDKFNSNRSSVSLGSDFNQSISTNFLSALQPKTKELMNALKAVDPNMPSNIEVAEVEMEIESNVISNLFALEYGLTDRLSIGLKLPFVYGDVSANATSSPTAEFSQLMNALPDGHPAKAALTSTQHQTSVEGLNAALVRDLGYDSGLESWSGTGFGDLELGFKYNYFKSNPWKMTLKSGVRIPTGRRDDPDLLFDLAYGDGQFDIGAFHFIDYTPYAWLGFTWESGYTYQLPHEATFRAPIIEGVDITPVKAKLNRKLGDIAETALEASWNPVKTIKLSGRYRFSYKFEDDYSSAPAGVDTSLLESGTQKELHQLIATTKFSNLSWIKTKRARIPFELELFYYYPLAGKNTARTQTTGMQLKTYF